MNVLQWCTMSVVLPLVLTEVTELGPWMARWVVKLGARLVVPRELGRRLAEEWQAGIEEWPGKLTKLIRALVLVLVAVPKIDNDYFDRWWERRIGAPVGIICLSFNLRMFLSANWTVRLGQAPKDRYMLRQFNLALAFVLRQLRSANAEQRNEALANLEDLIDELPVWVRHSSPTFVKRSIRRNFNELVECVELRYALR